MAVGEVGKGVIIVAVAVGLDGLCHDRVQSVEEVREIQRRICRVGREQHLDGLVRLLFRVQRPRQPHQPCDIADRRIPADVPTGLVQQLGDEFPVAVGEGQGFIEQPMDMQAVAGVDDEGRPQHRLVQRLDDGFGIEVRMILGIDVGPDAID